MKDEQHMGIGNWDGIIIIKITPISFIPHLQWSNMSHCLQQFKKGLPDASKLFALPKVHAAD
jgi:hypothetical protein